MVDVPLDELGLALEKASATVHADRRVRGAATDSATPPEVRFIFELDAEQEDQALARAAAVVSGAVAGGQLARAQWTHRVRIVG